VFGDRPMVVGRELTKTIEEQVLGTTTSVQEHFERHEPSGEFTLVMAGAGQGAMLE
jgi:16S rRNA (cytidine1402-2'-O)-methyltransferase